MHNDALIAGTFPLEGVLPFIISRPVVSARRDQSCDCGQKQKRLEQLPAFKHSFAILRLNLKSIGQG